jgi:CheY-like chemotaxis protein
MMVDRMLPGIDGIVIIRCLRENGVTTPALIISAVGEVDDRVRGLPSRHTAVNRLANLTPDRRPILTLLFDESGR